MRVSAVVVSHGHARELERSLPALAPQVDELVVIANLPGSVGRSLRRPGRRERAAGLVRREREPRRRADLRRARRDLESGRLPEPGAVAELARFAAEHPRAGLVGPLVLWPDGTWQPSLRRFPTVLGTIWRRTPLRLLRDPYSHQVAHYGTRPDEPVQGDWLLGGACLLHAPLDARRARRLGRRLPPLRRGHRPRLPRRGGRLGALARPGGSRPPRLRRGRWTSASSTGTRSGTRAGWRASCASTPSGCSRCASRRPRRAG